MRRILITTLALTAALAYAAGPTITLNPLTITRSVNGHTYSYRPCLDAYNVAQGVPAPPASNLNHFFGPGGIISATTLIAYPKLGLEWVLVAEPPANPTTYTYMPLVVLTAGATGTVPVDAYTGTLPQWINTRTDLTAFTKYMQAHSANLTRALNDDNSVDVHADQLRVHNNVLPDSLVAHFPSNPKARPSYLVFVCQQ